MKVRKTKIEGLLVVENAAFADERGFFREVVRWDKLQQTLGKPFRPVQMNHSYSLPGVIRALHAENWNKLVYPVSGRLFAAIADIRPQSATFGKVETFVIGKNNRRALFLSKGLANSVCVRGTRAVNYLYLVDSYYDGTDTRAVAWDDPDLAIDWGIKKPILSKRDKNNPRLREMFPDKFK